MKEHFTHTQQRYIAIGFGLAMSIVLAIVAYYIQDAIMKSDLAKINSTQYMYNMSKEEQFDLRVSEICIELQIENPTCQMTYGGIETSNGEPIK